MWRAWWCVLGLGALAARAAAVVGGAPAAAPEPDAAVVFARKNGRSARIEGIKDNRLGYYSFFGIRYAEPPVGPRRFQRPVRRYLAGEVNSTQNCLPCPQPDPKKPQRVIGHEDCLCINIYAPKMPGEEQGCPVILFVHGGNYRSGSTASYGGQHFTQKDTILVTAQYRLGSLGYFSTAEKDASGNAGLFDLRAAMAWIKDYIEFFGGDINRIVVMGQGSGGSAASLLSLSAEGRTARGVVALSGAPLSPGAVRSSSEPVEYSKQLAKNTGCPEKPAERLLNCLRQLPFEKIVEADMNMTMDLVDTEKFLREISGQTGVGARVEGQDDLRALPPLVSEQPSDSLQRKRQDIPLLTGVTSAETSRAVFGKYSKFLTDKLASVKDFIKNELVGRLRSAVQGLVAAPASAVMQALPLPDYYQALFDNSLNSVDGLAQIAEATGDALFNFPAYQSVQQWSGDASPAYLYSFEHMGNLSKGSHFLPGVPLTDGGNSEKEGKTGDLKGPAHGDELAYLFEPLDDEGKGIGGEVSATDAKVRDNFVALISKFSHDLGSTENNKSKSFEFMPFSKDNEQFIKINENIEVDKDFRFCQMGLWGNMADRVTGALCKGLLGNLLNLPKLPMPLPVAPELPVPLPVDPGSLPGLPSLWGGGGDKTPTEPPKEVVQVTRKTTVKPRSVLKRLFNRSY